MAWQVYEHAIEKRFRMSFDDLVGELDNLKQLLCSCIKEQFEVLLNMVDISEKHAISLYITGLFKEVGLTVRLFKSRSLSDTYSLARL